MGTGVVSPENTTVDRKDFLNVLKLVAAIGGAAVLGKAAIHALASKDKTGETEKETHILPLEDGTTLMLENGQFIIQYNDLVPDNVPEHKRRLWRLYARSNKNRAPAVVDLLLDRPTRLNTDENTKLNRQFGEILYPRAFEITPLEGLSGVGAWEAPNTKSRHTLDNFGNDRYIKPGEKVIGIPVLTRYDNWLDDKVNLEKEVAYIGGKETDCTFGWAICRQVNLKDKPGAGLVIEGYVFDARTLVPTNV
ncbi:MAG: hypothetical protein UX85_C0007G0083 [Candidatus Beckwithbacteria bacterium GW2011_GWB1_47_15]|uniref:Uncharacterized protein n=1 Tax=Candidatus Beckwithbacteria bacterium GW2011_GWB1_47_15 TaxID=1618371 RepID=A0A0G1RUL8_9BACT|nr:MAG: hypothetical protein UY43_C0001G0497 [Candidatus Beckwithbacteria bacterium GW2011_GWC1_49_16]KKU35152.1 MAG: hypothetical protein UX50_C0006G0078 [Candidatus Beckwithbacteria bacterium GW2011_GWA1_46_30]KKU60796.1 MAG: hypothetical protein UX85_C0007G0083 [Candidatus Beckwithbacteria bacterium GW2011_GWB1_47_15]KKU71601.1 MAG: hypothetical protein UX97_C0005G0084 [Candidatus Beckwithbacteria bacterium GW2011_GWA2_47_25]KKW03446.1 MAG: hypothetical protein UY37_C0005G0009 [Candidatus Be